MKKSKIAMIFIILISLTIIIIFVTDKFGSSTNSNSSEKIDEIKNTNKDDKIIDKSSTVTNTNSPQKTKISPSSTKIPDSEDVSSETYYGIGKYYGGGYDSGAAMLTGSIYDGEYVCAMNQYDYNNSRLAGACIELTGPKGKIKLLVTDIYPGGNQGDIDLNKNAFAKIEDLSAGVADISWRIVERDVKGSIILKIKDGSSQNWMGVQVRNHKTPIEKLEILGSDGIYKVIKRTSCNYFELNNPGKGPFNFRVTDIFGKSIIEKDIKLKIGDNKGKNQF
ncbi:MAG: expansin EXLX1 family cellulose-binding protein [Clostridiales bacterium]